jgi:hypothetical protein
LLFMSLGKWFLSVANYFLMKNFFEFVQIC